MIINELNKKYIMMNISFLLFYIQFELENKIEKKASRINRLLKKHNFKHRTWAKLKW